MLTSDIVVINDLGLHARAAAELVRIAGRFKSSIQLDRPDRNIFANAKSILSVLTLAAAKGTRLVLTVDGDDEADAFDQVCKLFEAGFSEI